MIALQIGENVVRLFDRTEVAEVLGVRPGTVWHYLRDGRLPGQLIAGRWLVTEGNLCDFVSGKCATPEAAERLRHREARRRHNLRQYADDAPEDGEECEW